MRDAPFGVLNQSAYVVPNIEDAIDWWTEKMGVGPFFVFPALNPLRSDYRGKDADVQIRAAIAYSGELNIELIEPQSPSIFQEFRERGQNGAHHLCAFADDMATVETWITAKGGKRIQGSDFETGSVAYFAMNADESIILEIAVLHPEVLGLFEAVKQAGANWDGVTKTISF